MTLPAQYPIHVVQIGSDTTVFERDAASDTRQRQEMYARALDRQCPGSQMSLLVVTRRTDAETIWGDRLTIVPVLSSRRALHSRLEQHLEQLHARRPIHVIATQTIHRRECAIAQRFARREGATVVGQVHHDLFTPAARRMVLGGGLKGSFRFASSLRRIRTLAAVRVVGQRVGQEIRQRGLHDNVHVIPVPVTMADTSEAPAALTTDADVGEPTVLFVGRLAPEKNLEGWLAIAARLVRMGNPARFVLAGDGPLRPELERLAGRLGLSERVEFRGAVPYAALPSLYRRASVLLLTSHFEGFGRVLVEAYRHGLPAVAPAIGGVEDIVETGRTGWLHAPRDEEGIALSVQRLLGNPHLRRAMGEMGRQLVRERFDPHTLGERWVQLLINTAMGPRPER